MPNQEVNATQFDAQHQPPRCQHTLLSGETCGQPALRGTQLCRFHRAVAPVRREFILPIVEDAASLQLALNRVMRALADDVLTYKKASLLLYALQIAASNFKRLREERQDTSHRASTAEEESLLKLLLQQLAIPETPEELAAEFAAQEQADQPITGSPDHPMKSDHPMTPTKFDIKACADEHPNHGTRAPLHGPSTSLRAGCGVRPGISVEAPGFSPAKPAQQLNRLEPWCDPPLAEDSLPPAAFIR